MEVLENKYYLKENMWNCEKIIPPKNEEMEIKFIKHTITINQRN